MRQDLLGFTGFFIHQALPDTHKTNPPVGLQRCSRRSKNTLEGRHAGLEEWLRDFLLPQVREVRT